MGFIKTIFSQPWLGDATATETVPGGNMGAGMRAPLKVKRTGLFIFMGVATALFGLFSIAYKMRMGMGGWTNLSDPAILWTNTYILVAGSIFMHLASRFSARGNMGAAKKAFIVGGLAGFAFLVGQYMAWQQLNAAGLYAQANPANAFFFVLTGLHGLHLLGGLYAWGLALFKTTSGAPAADTTASIKLCDYYWSYLLLLWLAMFAMLLST